MQDHEILTQTLIIPIQVNIPNHHKWAQNDHPTCFL